VLRTTVFIGAGQAELVMSDWLFGLLVDQVVP
jgi:hypothetical protein